MIAWTDAFTGHLPRLRGVLAGADYAPRGPTPEDCLEAWYPGEDDFTALLNSLAEEYARRHLGVRADVPDSIMCTCYTNPMACIDHIDQYFGREGHTDTGDRTVSVSVLVDRADDGGEMIFQDYERKKDPIVTNFPPGTAVFFPADWWHRVAAVQSGVRRSVVRWYSDSSGARFQSEVSGDQQS